MRKTIAIFVLIALLTASVVADAATLASVTLPDSAQVAGKTLVLNGVGLRTKFIVKVYVAGLYLEQKSSDAAAILKSDAPKRLVMHFVRDVSRNQMTDAFQEGFDKNSPDAAKSMKPDIDRLLAAVDDIREGQEMVFTYLPGTGTTMSINGKDKVTIASPAFAAVVFSLWLGPKPPNADLKKGILGQ